MREKESVKETEPTALEKLASEGTFHYFCYILSIRSESLGPFHPQGDESVQGCAYEGVGSLGPS